MLSRFICLFLLWIVRLCRRWKQSSGDDFLFLRKCPDKCSHHSRYLSRRFLKICTNVFIFCTKNIADMPMLFLEDAPPVHVIRPSFLDVSGNQWISDLICYKKSVSNGMVTTESSVVINVPCAMMVSPFSYWMQNKVP